MKFPLHILLIASHHCIIPATAAVDVKIKDYALLSEALHRVVSEVIGELAVTLNVISINDNHASNDFRDTFMKEVMQQPAILLRQQMLESLESLGARGPRKTCLMPFQTYQDFLTLYAQMNDEIFVNRGIYIFVLTDGRFKEIEKMFALLWDNQIFNVNVIYESGDGRLAVETFFPFSSRNNCSNTQPVVINEYRRGDSFARDIKATFFPAKMNNLKHCQVRVSTSNVSVPYIYMKTMQNGERRLHGRDYDFIRTLAQTMNFRINFTYVGKEGYMFSNGTAGGSFLWLLNGEADLTLADYWLKPSRLRYFDASTTYINEKLVFVLPVGAELSSVEKLLYPLTFSTWIMLIACFFAGYVVIFAIKCQSQAIQNFVFGTRVNYPYLNMWIGLTGTLQHRMPGRNFSRFLLTLFLLFCLVIRTAYQGKMYHFMQSNKKHSPPQTIDEIIERSYKFTVLNIHIDYMADRTRMSSLEVKPLTLELSQWAKQIDGDEKNTILLPYTQVYYKLIDNSTLNLQICREVFLTIPTVIYTTKNFYLLGAINDQIEAFNAAGLIDYWHSLSFDRKHMRPDDSKQPKVLTLRHLSGVFNVWGVGCSVSALAFIVECAIVAWKRNHRK